jgi:predicted lipoprotein with Yx(FWY)xxD motif
MSRKGVRPAPENAMRTSARGAAGVILIGLVVGGCGGAHIAVPTGAAPTTGAQGPGYMVHAHRVGSLGTVITDGYDETLYLFVPDAAGGRSTCVQSCAAKWPPLSLPAAVTQPFVGPGAQAALVGTTRRADGRIQVTYAGWPLYHYVGDTEAGQATGEGLNDSGGLWYAVDPSGHAVRAGG